MKIKTLIKSMVPICLSICIAVPSIAADTKASEDELHFTLSPLFLWGMGIDGSSTVGSEELPLQLDFGDVLDNLDAVFTIHFEMQKGDWTIFAEYQYVDLEPSVSTPSGVEASIGFVDQMGELGVAYRVATLGINDLQILGGARLTSQDLDVQLGPGIQLLDISESWVDGFVGMRVFTHISDNWTFIGRGDIGAGGSDFVWNLVGMVDYQFKDWGSVFFGYRWLDYDYSSGSGKNYYAYDALQQGPLAGIAFHW